MARLQRALSSALNEAAAAGDALGGTTSLAIWLQGSPAPLLASTGRSQRSRFWSIAKPIAAVAAYRTAASGDSRSLTTAASDAIRRSDNCGERVVILELERLAHGAQQAKEAFGRVLVQAGAHFTAASGRESLAAQPECLPYLRDRARVVDPALATWQFGTYRWTVGDAVSFAHALGAGVYGRAGARVLRMMQLPKQESLVTLEGPTGNHIADLQWGAGRAFGPWAPAFKSGWGGSHEADFVASQIVVIDAARPPVAIAISFHPILQPGSDDLGATRAPAAIQRVLTLVASALERQHVLE